MAETKAKASALKFPAGTDPFLWKVAAAWADVPVAELLADTAPVKAAHYQAAERVEKTFDREWDRIDAVAAELAAAGSGQRLAGEIPGTVQDSFARAMRLAEDMAALTAQARDGGNAVKALKYSSFEQSLLQVAAGLQIANDVEKRK